MSLPDPKKVAAWVAICVACVAGFEGLRTKPYYDVGGVPTACFGETKNIKMGDRFTVEQCRQMLGDRIEKDFGPGVDRCIKHELPAKRKAAYVSFAYNVGVGAFCASSTARLENAGQPVAACNAMIAYDKIRQNGVLTYSQGLRNRRLEEIELCLEGI